MRAAVTAGTINREMDKRVPCAVCGLALCVWLVGGATVEPAHIGPYERRLIALPAIIDDTHTHEQRTAFVGIDVQDIAAAGATSTGAPPPFVNSTLDVANEVARRAHEQLRRNSIYYSAFGIVLPPLVNT